MILRCFRGIGHELLFGATALAAAMRDLGYFPPFGVSLLKVRPPVTAMNLCTRFSQGTNQGGMLYDWFQNEKLMNYVCVGLSGGVVACSLAMLLAISISA